MKYKIVKLDSRFSYRKWFAYYIGFADRMAQDHGPVCYNDALRWLFETYGWSAEIRQYDRIMQWMPSSQIYHLLSQKPVSGILTERSEHCNPHWSWSNHFSDLRIYIAGEPELAFFQLKFPLDQK